MLSGRSSMGLVVVAGLLGSGAIACRGSSATVNDAAADTTGGVGTGGTSDGGNLDGAAAGTGGAGESAGGVGSGGTGTGGTAGVAANDGSPGSGGDTGDAAGGDVLATAPGCSVDGWCWRNPSPQTNALRGVFAPTASRAWAVGDRGAMVQWDGNRWAALASVTTLDLGGVWGLGATELWAGGAMGVVLISDGANWSVTATGSVRPIKGVWASAGNLLAVDDVGEVYQRPRVAAGAWVRLTSGSYSLGVTAFFADGAGHGFVNDIYSSRRIRSWTGSAWSAAFGPAVTSAWGDGAGTFWAWTSSHELVKFDATATSPAVGSSGSLESGVVWGAGPTDIWVATDAGRAYRYAGGTWTSLGQIVNEQTPALFGIAGSSASDVWAVGDGGTIVHWDGQAWSSATSGSRAHLRAVWGSGPDDVWAGGSSSTLLHGAGFPASMLAVPAAVAVTVSALYGTGPDAVWAGTTNGDVAQWNGTAWTLAKPIPGVVRLWAGGGEVWFCASNDTVGRWNGTTFEPHPTGNVAACTAIWGSGPDDIWVGTVEGQASLFHWNGSAWTPTALSIGSIRDIHGSGPNDVWVVGGSSSPLAMPNMAAHFDGTRWTTFATGVTFPLVSVWSNGPTSAWAVGDKGTILSWNGQVWSPSQSGTSQPLFGVWSNGARTFVVGAWGTVLER